MLTVNIHDAKTQLSKLIAMAVNGQPFIIAKAGKPMVKVEAVDGVHASSPPLRGMGFLKGKMPPVPDDFDTMCADDINKMFYGDE
ncbi:MAG: type II toxin-antitoxin system prevent-host-death family antitoxin [Sphingomonadaceae bacterium]|nr:type II toxin-antitoxin system prevent-host-death family antitoxin [Sphingomonadaceae bacterium]